MTANLEILALWGALLVLVLRYLAPLDAVPERAGALVVDGTLVPDSCIVKARSYVNGRAGLLNHARLGPKDGLLLERSRSVHTRGMLFPIDVAFLGAEGRVLAVYEAVAPSTGRLAAPAGGRATLELAAGAAARLGVKPGARIEVRA